MEYYDCQYMISCIFYVLMDRLQSSALIFVRSYLPPPPSPRLVTAALECVCQFSLDAGLQNLLFESMPPFGGGASVFFVVVVFLLFFIDTDPSFFLLSGLSSTSKGRYTLFLVDYLGA